MLKLAKVGKKAEAEAINQTLIPLHKNLFIESNPIPVKKALQILGKMDAGIRPPLVTLDPVHVSVITAALKTAGSI